METLPLNPMVFNPRFSHLVQKIFNYMDIKSLKNCKEAAKPWQNHIDNSQCAPSIFNLDQKFHGLSCFWGIDINEAVLNQSRKTSVIRLPKV